MLQYWLASKLRQEAMSEFVSSVHPPGMPPLPPLAQGLGRERNVEGPHPHVLRAAHLSPARTVLDHRRRERGGLFHQDLAMGEKRGKAQVCSYTFWTPAKEKQSHFLAPNLGTYGIACGQ